MNKVLTEFLLLYKECSCLWDNRQVAYVNKEARDEAYNILLQKYKELQEDATILEVKRKIEYMRSAYRREHKKVLLSRLNGDEEMYVPQLWYYERMTFLNDVSDFKCLDFDASIQKDSESEGSNFRNTLSIESIKQEKWESSSTPKRKKNSRTLSEIYFADRSMSNDYDGDLDDHDRSIDKCNSVSSACRDAPSSETAFESFGKTIGLQLKELNTEQRNIAEKLISEVIFFARFNALTINSKIVNEEK